jgi:hypothetical protein
MNISEETLMAFADGEADEPTRAAVERAMREDPEVSRRIERHRALRRRLQAGFAEELAEAVPERLLAVVRGSASAASGNNVVSLKTAQAARARAARSAAAGPRDGAAARPTGMFWRAAPAIAAGVLLGLGIGYGAWREAGLPIGRGAAGTLIANGTLEAALTNQLTGEAANGSAVRIGLSFVAKSGDYCRTFTLAASPASGLACRHADQWQIQALTQDGAVRGDGYRPAATAWSPVILKMIQDEIQGEPLDATGESSARQHHWQSPK